MNLQGEQQELIKKLYDAVLNMEEEVARDTCHAILEKGIDAYYAVKHGLSAAMDKAGELYTNQVYFVPELLLCSDALYAGLEVLKPHIRFDQAEQKRQIVIGTVEGDIHDIGKNLVRIMFEAAGWTVHDLGRDVKLQRFVDELERTKSDVVAMSALMTTSMMAMPKAIEMIRAVEPNVPIMLGGAPLTYDIAKNYGADDFADNAGEAVGVANAMLKRLNR
jgi:methanogenic corrinoid protein MtbC1